MAKPKTKTTTRNAVQAPKARNKPTAKKSVVPDVPEQTQAAAPVLDVATTLNEFDQRIDKIADAVTMLADAVELLVPKPAATEPAVPAQEEIVTGDLEIKEPPVGLVINADTVPATAPTLDPAPPPPAADSVASPVASSVPPVAPSVAAPPAASSASAPAKRPNGFVALFMGLVAFFAMCYNGLHQLVVMALATSIYRKAVDWIKTSSAAHWMMSHKKLRYASIAALVLVAGWYVVNAGASVLSFGWNTTTGIASSTGSALVNLLPTWNHGSTNDPAVKVANKTNGKRIPNDDGTRFQWANFGAQSLAGGVDVFESVTQITGEYSSIVAALKAMGRNNNVDGEVVMQVVASTAGYVEVTFSSEFYHETEVRATADNLTREIAANGGGKTLHAKTVQGPRPWSTNDAPDQLKLHSVEMFLADN